MGPAGIIDAIRALLTGCAPGAEPVRADVEAMLLDLATPAMGVGQLNRLLAMRVESERFADMLAEPEPWTLEEIEACRTRALEALDELAEVFGLPRAETLGRTDGEN